MILERKPMTSLTSDDIRSLLTDRVSESRTVDYKEALPGNSDSQKKEFLSDVSSFANSAGGFLVFGIKEDTGVPSGFSGLEVSDEDALILRLESIIRDGIEPRIPNVSTRCISISNGEFVVIMHIPRSFVSPHMVTFQGHDRFYLRESRGKHSMDVNELRRAFETLATTNRRIADFRTERVGRISQGDTPIKMSDGAKVILHLLPFTMNDASMTCDLDRLRNQLIQMRPLWTFSGWSDQYTFDGIVTFDGATSPTHTYLQVFRNGSIEAVSTGLLSPMPEQTHLQIPSVAFERELIEGLKRYMRIQQILEITPPFKVALTLIGMKGYSMGVDPMKLLASGLFHIFTHTTQIDQDDLSIPAVIVSNENQDAETILKPIFDRVWNASGWHKSLNYDNNGRWNP